MATDLELLTTARTNLLTALAEHGHKRNYSIDGQTFNTGELWDRLEKVNSQIAAIQGPFEDVTQGVT